MKGSRGFAILVMVVLSLGAFSPPISAQPIELTDCGVIRTPGSYILTRNLTIPLSDPVGHCFTINSNFVTLDLGGFRIKGNRLGNAIRTREEVSHRDIVIRNGTLIRFEEAIDLDSTGENVTVESVRFFDNVEEGIDIEGMAVVKGCTFFRNGMGLKVGPRSIVVDNTANFNEETGIRVGAGSRVEGNISNSNDQNGIVVGIGSTVINNTAFDNEGVGITVNCPSNVIGNTATNNDGRNLDLEGSDCNSSNNLAP